MDRVISDIPESEKIIHEFVKFENVLISYDASQSFYIEFSLDNSVKGSSKDWIGIFPAGWNSYEAFLAHECALGMPCDETGRWRRVRFLSKDLQHAKSGVPYQFVYVNKYLEIMGVSQYFHFSNNNSQEKQAPFLDETECEASFSPNQESSPVKVEPSNEVNNKSDLRHNKDICIFRRSNNCSKTALYKNCQLYSTSKWSDSCTSCYLCEDLFRMKSSHDQLTKKIKHYQEQNFALQERVIHLEKYLKWRECEEKNNLNTCMIHFSEAIDNAIRSSVFGEENKKVFSNGCLDWDFSSKELYLKAVIGQQELTIRDLNKVICELGYIDQPKVCCQPSVSLQDTVKKIQTETKEVAEIYDINNNTSEEEF